MYKLIKTELSYFNIPLSSIIILSIFFTVCAFNDIEIFTNPVFLNKYFWAIIVGLGTYGLVFIIWMQRVKEKHERVLSLLPETNKKISISRWLFAVMPFIATIVYIQVIHFFLSDSWSVHVGRISAQIGFLSMALASMFLVRDLWFIYPDKSDIFKIFLGVIVFLITAAGAVIIILFFNYELVKPFFIYQEELMFLVWGVVVSAVSIIIYQKRKNYLE